MQDPITEKNAPETRYARAAADYNDLAEKAWRCTGVPSSLPVNGNAPRHRYILLEDVRRAVYELHRCAAALAEGLAIEFARFVPNEYALLENLLVAYIDDRLTAFARRDGDRAKFLIDIISPLSDLLLDLGVKHCHIAPDFDDEYQVAGLLLLCPDGKRVDLPDMMGTNAGRTLARVILTTMPGELGNMGDMLDVLGVDKAS